MNQQQQDKAAFFAQYWGQYIKTSDTHSAKGLKPIEIFAHSIQYVDAGSYLLLKPLSAITDEDALKLSQILHPCIGLANVDHGKAIAESLTLFGVCTNQEIGARFAWSIQYISDSLRSRGYLIPFRNYSTDQILEMGWAKLRES